MDLPDQFDNIGPILDILAKQCQHCINGQPMNISIYVYAKLGVIKSVKWSLKKIWYI